jgi:arginine N-succinyltransferase
MWVVRPAQPDDLGSILHIVQTRSRGLSSTLPRESHALAERIALSERSLADTLATNTDELSTCEAGRYLFVLEDSESGKIRGVSAIDARAGNGEPFYNYRRDCLIHASRELGISRRVEVLFPSHAITNRALLCGFGIDAELVGSPAFQLLSRSRLLFIAEHRQHFSDRIAVEIQGLQDQEGRVPFWDSLGRHFFNMDFRTADQYSSKLTKTFIAELMPPNPIYVTLLSEQAQSAIGESHDAAKPACQLLESEGFEAGAYVDIFDAGPVLEAETDKLKTLRSCRTRILHSEAEADAQPQPETGREKGTGSAATPHLVAAGKGSHFRATLTPLADTTGDRVTASGSTCAALNRRAGDPVLIATLSDENHLHERVR